MKIVKIVSILLLSFVFLNADEYTLKLYEKLLSSIFKDYPIRVYADKESSKELKKSDLFVVQDKCDSNTDVIVGSQFSQLSKSCKNKPVFATSYKEYGHNDNAFGAFYWRKGRPQVHFKQKTLTKFGLQLPQKLKRFVDE